MLQDPGKKEAWVLGQTQLLILESLLKRQEATGAHPGDIDTDGSHFGELILWPGHWCWQAPFWKPPPNLLVPAPISTHHPVGTSTGTSQAKQLIRWRQSLILQQANCLKTPWAHSHPRPSPAHEWASTSLRLCSPTSGQALAAGKLGPWPHPPVGQHTNSGTPRALHSETLRSSPTHHWTGISPRNWPHPPVGRHQSLDPLGPNPTHQQGDTSPMTTTALQPAISRSRPPTSRPTPALVQIEAFGQPKCKTGY